MNDIVSCSRGMIFWRQNWDGAAFDVGILGKNRPIVVVGNDQLAGFSAVLVAPLSLSTPDELLPTQVKLFMKEDEPSIVRCDQIYLEQKKNFGTFIGVVSPTKMKEIDKAIECAFGLSDSVEFPNLHHSASEVKNSRRIWTAELKSELVSDVNLIDSEEAQLEDIMKKGSMSKSTLYSTYRRFRKEGVSA